MNRPYIFCHMMTALDGKITGDYAEAVGNGTVAEESPCTLGNKGRGKGLFESDGSGFTPK